MNLLDTEFDLGMYQTAYVIKVLIRIAFIIIPIVLIVLGTLDLGKAITNPEKLKDSPLTIGRRILAGIIIFLIPTMINNVITLLASTNANNVLIKIYEEATPEKIKSLQTQLETEGKNQENLLKAKEKEESVVNGKAVLKTEQDLEEQDENVNNQDINENNGNGGSNDNNDNNNNEGGNVNTNENASSGKVTVKNGVFYIPNKRATSDADTPKQSGKGGLNPVFWERLSKLINDAKAKGYKVTITSGLRPYSRQLKLWNNSSRPCSQRSKWVACPGGSRHGWGIAADLKYNGKSCDQNHWNCNAAATWVHNNASKYGLKFRMKHEPWHIEPSQVKGGSYGSCKASCR